MLREDHASHLVAPDIEQLRLQTSTTRTDLEETWTSVSCLKVDRGLPLAPGI